jgi:phosphate starvation-inducible PhoH-like protein
MAKSITHGPKRMSNATAKRSGSKISGRTPNHKRYLEAIDKSTITFCLGPAGTGKTWMSCGRAIEMLQAGQVERVVVTRPMVSCGEELGFLPGDIGGKISPFVQPAFDAFGDHLSKEEIDKYVSKKAIYVVPLAVMRGLTFKRSIVILDEAQNATFPQLRMLLTRFGEHSKVVINGDPTQSDLSATECPLMRVIDRLQARPELDDKPISIVTMGREDVMRHELIQWLDEVLAVRK